MIGIDHPDDPRPCMTTAPTPRFAALDQARRRYLLTHVAGLAVSAAATAQGWPTAARAEDLHGFRLRVVLPPPADVLSYGRSQLEALGVTGLTTAVPWDAQPRHWEGVSLRRLATAIHATGRPLLVKALNDYVSHIPWSDLEQYNPLLAWLRDGQPIPIRAKGPLVVIYPFTARPELRGDVYNGRSVWHVSEIVVE
jgi:hypothetical protein